MKVYFQYIHCYIGTMFWPRKHLFFFFIIPLMLLFFWSLVLFNFIDTTSLSISNLEYGYTKKNFTTPQPDKLLKGQKAAATFVAQDNFLGIVAVRFNTFGKINKDKIIFRIKEKGKNNWAVQNSYDVNQFLPNELFTFGFPVITSSKGKTYVFEIQSLAGTPKNAVAISTTNPIFVTRHNYSVYLAQNGKKAWSTFFVKKVANLCTQTNFLLVTLLSFLPFALYVFFLFRLTKKLPGFLKKNTFLQTLDEFFLLHKNKEFPALDGIRGTAILLVLMAHIGSQTLAMTTRQSSHVSHVFGIVVDNIVQDFPFFGAGRGGIGVDIFFMLSGFLMYLTIVKKHPSFFTFLFKRARRLLPAHIAVIFGGFAGLSLVGIVLNISFLVNFFPKLPNINIVTWTLAYELVFYIICACWFITAKKYKAVQSWGFFFAFSLLVYISPVFFYEPLLKLGVMYLDTTRFIAFFFGVGLCKLFLSERLQWDALQKYFVFLAIPSFVGIVLLKYPFFTSFIETLGGIRSYVVLGFLLDVCLFLLLGSLLVKKSHIVKQFFAHRSLRIFGAVSYSLYLTNYSWGIPTALGLINDVNSTPVRQITFVVVAFVVNFMIATFLFHFLEKPYFLSRKTVK